LRELAARKLPEVEALITRAHAMRDWLQTATDCSCTTLDACALFDPDRPAATGGDFAPLLITHVTLGRVLLADS
jgi:hypothetical protein